MSDIKPEINQLVCSHIHSDSIKPALIIFLAHKNIPAPNLQNKATYSLKYYC
jgi:hypothetical protein